MPKIVVLGLGSIGERHLRNLRALGEEDIAVVRVLNRAPRDPALLEGVTVYRSLEQALGDGVEAAVICTPASMHTQAALEAAEAGCHLFIEKPVSDRLDDLDRLCRLVAARELVSLVGFNLRFHPALCQLARWIESGAVGRVLSVRAEAGQYLPDWHPWEDYRIGYSARRALGGGVILDLIHEIDYAAWLFGSASAVFCMGGRHSSLEIDTEDVVEILLRCERAPVVEIHLDYLQRRYRRTCQVIGEEGTLFWNDAEGRAWIERAGASTDEERRFSLDRNEMFVAEMRHFLQCIARREMSRVPLEDGVRSLRIALAARRSLETRRIEHLEADG
ncbi:MAG: Gfo/Idh/MocA family protein [Gemmatimonadaceae bacterium]